MSILIKSGDKYYQIPEAELKKFKITKREFDKSQQQTSSDVAGQSSDCSLVDLRGCCMSKKSLYASCH
jgi:hypothetical protein